MEKNLTYYVSPLEVEPLQRSLMEIPKEESLLEHLKKPQEEMTLIAMPYSCLTPYHLTTVHEFHQPVHLDLLLLLSLPFECRSSR